MSDDYFKIPALSVSGIHAFYESPLHYWMESPFNPNKIEREETPSMLFGSVCHKLVLERDLFDKEYIVAPKLDMRKTIDKGKYQEFLLQANGKKAITKEMYNDAVIMADAVYRNKAALSLLTDGQSELPISWEKNCNYHGRESIIKCKGKIDRLKDGLIIDYKTTRSANPIEFAKSVVNFGYHRQSAWYSEGFEQVTEIKPDGFVFIAQDVSLPDAIGIYVLDEESIRRGVEENNFAANEISLRLKTNDWKAFPEEIVTIGLPNWYKQKGKQYYE